jgi:hypothetical protein
MSRISLIDVGRLVQLALHHVALLHQVALDQESEIYLWRLWGPRARGNRNSLTRSKGESLQIAPSKRRKRVFTLRFVGHLVHSVCQYNNFAQSGIAVSFAQPGAYLTRALTLILPATESIKQYKLSLPQSEDVRLRFTIL